MGGSSLTVELPICLNYWIVLLALVCCMAIMSIIRIVQAAGLLAFPVNEFAEIVSGQFLLEFLRDRHQHDIVQHGLVERQRHRIIRAVEHLVRHEEFQEPNMIHVEILTETHQGRHGNNDVGVHVLMLHHVPQAHFHIVENTAMQLQDFQLREIHADIIKIQRRLILGARAGQLFAAGMKLHMQSQLNTLLIYRIHLFLVRIAGCSGVKFQARETALIGDSAPYQVQPRHRSGYARRRLR